MLFLPRAALVGTFLSWIAVASGCDGASASDGDPATGGSTGTGGAAMGGSGTGGASGAATGGATTGGATTGGATTGGATTGGATTGGASGSETGGSSGAATGGIAGSAGGSSGAAGSAGSAGGTGCASAIFCDDFDDAPANGAPKTPWTVQRSGAGTAVIDGAHHMSGTQSVKFTVPGQSDGAYIALSNAPVFPVTGNAFYGRMMLWLTAAPTADVHWTIIEGSGLVQGQSYHAAYRLGGQHPITAGNQLMANYETPDGYNGNGPRTDCYRHASGKVVPAARWSCVEWFYDGPNNAMTLWIDGSEMVTVRGTGEGCVSQPASYVWTAPNFDSIRVGWDSYQADTERTLWIDDVAVGTARVGCPSGTGQ